MVLQSRVCDLHHGIHTILTFTFPLFHTLPYHILQIHLTTQSEFSYFASDDVATYVKVLITLDPVLTVTPTVQEEVTLGSMIHEDRPIGE